jgi:hypothetical protein
MKRHLTSILQRRHADFSETRSAGRRPAPIKSVKSAVVVGVQDGYDWLATIKREPGQRVR